MPKRTFELDLLPERYAIVRLDPEAKAPDWTFSSSFLSMTRTARELSIVCDQAALPPAVEAERGQRCLGVRGPLQFDEIGILAALTRVLAEAGISIFSVSTYDTDYLLVAERDLAKAVRALAKAGHVVHARGAG